MLVIFTVVVVLVIPPFWIIAINYSIFNGNEQVQYSMKKTWDIVSTGHEPKITIVKMSYVI